MAFDFPNSPTLGQAYGNYLWDGEKWTLPNLVDAIAARKSIYAAPLDAMAYNGMQINGSMDVSQELGAGNLTSVAGVTFSKYILDGWVGIAILPTGSVTFGQTPMAARLEVGLAAGYGVRQREHHLQRAPDGERQ